MLTTTFKKLKAAGACEDRYKRLAKALGGITAYGKDTPITLLQILELNGLDDALWALRASGEAEERDKIARLFACACAVARDAAWGAYPADKRLRHAIEVARRYAVGEASEEERDAARHACDAARAVAWGAAGNAARHARAVAACTVAAWDAAWNTEREAQKQILINLLGGPDLEHV